MAAMMSEFEYFGASPMQTQIRRAFHREYTPITALQQGSPITINVPGADRLYLDLARSYLLVRAKITKADGTAIAADTAGPVNLPLHSMFSRVEVELNGKTISDPTNLYPYRAYLETLLTFDPDVQKTQLENAIWAKDTAGQMTVTATAAGSANEGLVKRANFFKQSAEVQMLGRIHDDIFHQPRAIPANISVRIRLVPSNGNFSIISPPPAGGDLQIAYKFEITDLRFYVMTYEVTAENALAHIRMLEHHNARLPLRRVTLKHLSIAANTTTALFDNVYLGTLPERLVVAFVADADMSGGYQRNPFNFHHFGLNYLSLYVNGEQIPNIAYQPNFASNHYLREYNSIHEGMGVLFTDKTIDIKRSEFAAGYGIYVFDLTPDHNAKDSISPQRTGSVRIDAKFSAALAATTNIILYGEFESYLEIDKYHNIITPF